jgi:hypothetical protein
MNKLFRFAGFIAIAAGALSGQAVVEPEFSDVFYRLDQGKLIPLERQAVNVKVKISPLLFVPLAGLAAHTKGDLELDGARSPVRFQTGKVEFVVRLPKQGEGDPDPESLYHLRQLKSGHKNRTATVIRGSVVGVSIRGAEGVIAPQYSRYGTGSVKLTVKLPPGEYALGRQHGQAVFCFGVD